MKKIVILLTLAFVCCAQVNASELTDSVTAFIKPDFKTKSVAEIKHLCNSAKERLTPRKQELLDKEEKMLEYIALGCVQELQLDSICDSMTTWTKKTTQAAKEFCPGHSIKWYDSYVMNYKGKKTGVFINRAANLLGYYLAAYVYVARANACADYMIQKIEEKYY